MGFGIVGSFFIFSRIAVVYNGPIKETCNGMGMHFGLLGMKKNEAFLWLTRNNYLLAFGALKIKESHKDLNAWGML